MVAVLLLAGGTPALADGGVTFTDIVPMQGLSYARAENPEREAERQQAFIDAATAPIPVAHFLSVTRPESPEKSRGGPGVAIFDYDGDGDLDVYVTNGPGAPNALFENQLAQSGSATFVDVAAQAGVEATAQESMGVCYGDTDNDGDQDLYVLGLTAPAPIVRPLHIFFRNNGDGTFTDITAAAGLEGKQRHAVACSFGDVDGDGLLDVVIANTYDDWSHRRTVFNPGPTYAGMEHNELYVNLGGNTFADVSAASGIENVSNMSGPGLTGGAHTWAIAMTDIDLDGDIDIISADNQGAPPGNPSERRGWNRLFQNDGSGQFTDVTIGSGLEVENSWMGLSFGDINCDGYMDFFDTGLGDYLGGTPTMRSVAFCGSASGQWTVCAPSFPDVFGWGTSMFDYDNDADTDILYHGGMDILNLVVYDNPGVILRNTGTCSGAFIWDQPALDPKHVRRVVEGVATGDLNDDGFFDIVTVSSLDVPPGQAFFVLMINLFGALGGPFDPVGRFQNVLTSRVPPAPPGGFLVPVNPFPTFLHGTLTIELSSAGNGNNWVKFSTAGSAGLLPGGTINRDGIGATVKFTPDGGPTSMLPVLGGSSYASENSLEVGFGLGAATQGTAEVVWPGGFKNRLYDVQAGERLILPAIPCSFDGTWPNFGTYNDCVMGALEGYLDAGVIDAHHKNRLRDSARRAFEETQ